VSIAETVSRGRRIKLRFTPEAFRNRLLLWICVQHIPFSVVENAEFRDLLTYSQPTLHSDFRGDNDTFPHSHTTIGVWILELFALCRIVLISYIQQSKSSMHISFDLWSSPQKYSFLGVIGHFIDHNWKNVTILLGLKRLYGPHTGANMASLLIEVIKTYDISKRLGYCMIDNASDNDTALDTVEDYMQSLHIPWEANEHRLRCFGHIVNLIVGAFLSNKPVKQVRQSKPVRRKGKSVLPIYKADKVKWVRPVDAVTYIHIIVHFAMLTGQRIEEFESYTVSTGDEDLHLIKDQETRWFSVYYSLVRALILRNSIDLFVFNHRHALPTVKNLSHCQMVTDDWNYIKEVVDFMAPFEQLIKVLEHRDENGKITSIH